MPYIISPLLPGNGPDKCAAGFTVGFALSIFLWFMFNKKLTYTK